jgi:DNA-binding Lrp family transcriptional regulator
MKPHLTQFQKQLCNILQDGLPLCSKPFADIAVFMQCSETEVLSETAKLKAQGVIRRICALINHRALGRIGTLVTAHVPEDELGAVVEVINAIPGVSHNYQRQHFYNLWFTLQGRSNRELKLIIRNLSARFDIEFHSLASERVFKLDVRFDAKSDGQRLLPDIGSNGEDKHVRLTGNQKLILQKLQQGLDAVTQPFNIFQGGDIDGKTVFRTIETLLNKNVIRRIAAIVDHRKLGFTANLMLCCRIAPEQITTAGERLAKLPIVSHCYQRKTFEGWPYNLYAMMHAGSMGQIQHTIEKFVTNSQINDYELLPTQTEFKKEPVKYGFDNKP